MPDMPGLIARPHFLRLHDDFMNASRENRRQMALGLLSGESLADVFKSLRLGNRRDWQHLEREFYAEEGPLAYWPYNRYGFLGNKQEILRQGLLETIRVAEQLPETRINRRHLSRPWPADPVVRPLETWWMCSGTRFEVNVLDGDRQVTIMILTPAMPKLPDSRKVKLENPGFIWTVGQRAVLQGYRDEYPAGQTRYPTLKQAYRVARRQRQWRELRRLNKFQE